MNDSYLLLLLVLCFNAVRDSELSNLKENVHSLLDTSSIGVESENLRRGLKTFLQENGDGQGDVKLVRKDNVQKAVRTHEKKFRRDMSVSQLTGTTTSIIKNKERSFFHVDPVFDLLKNRRLWQKSPKVKNETSSSSEIEMHFWLEDWEENREHEKAKAFNASHLKSQEMINMNVARPSGIPCGDHNQHDLPWGICLKPAECEDEYRIYRGDYNCGRTQYICCAIIETAYDMNEALDVSFEHDNSLTTDSDLEKPDTREVKYRDRLLQKHEKRKAKRTKARMQKRIRNSIISIVNVITRLLRKSYRNTTVLRRLKTQELMKFVQEMKKQYLDNRQLLTAAHGFDIMKTNLQLQATLDNIKGVNLKFITNETFRDIVINGTVNNKELKRLQRTHPVLSPFYNNRRMGGDLESEQTRTRELEAGKERSGIEEDEPGIDEDGPRAEEDGSETEKDETETRKQPSKRLDYDVELGVLYY